VKQDLMRIDDAIADGSFAQNEVLLKAIGAARDGGRLHLLGLVSHGGVHASERHLKALIEMASAVGVGDIVLHAFTDGRDTLPTSGAEYVAEAEEWLRATGHGRIGTVSGRYYAMDRDKRWERTQRAYDLLTKAIGQRATDPIAGINESYERGVTDEFVEPIAIVRKDGSPVATIKDDDSVIFFNFRPDRARQLTRALALPDFNEFEITDRPRVHFVCFTMYDNTFNLPTAFPPRQHRNVLAEVWGDLKVRNYRLAETEKYAHVTYFFNGGVEKEYPCEQRLLVPSPKIATYDLQPEMSAFKVTDKVLRAIDDGDTDVFVINFANTDNVGHTGKLDNTIEACQYVDTCLGWITKRIREARGITLITADHGNAEQMIDPTTGSPHTAHTTNPVPFHLIDEESTGTKLRSGGALEDVAPTLLGLLDLKKPSDMTGIDLRNL
jgi:2,3-bisphosphoglycerate-independent phosphoglycerate mutase